MAHKNDIRVLDYFIADNQPISILGTLGWICLGFMQRILCFELIGKRMLKPGAPTRPAPLLQLSRSSVHSCRPPLNQRQARRKSRAAAAAFGPWLRQAGPSCSSKSDVSDRAPSSAASSASIATDTRCWYSCGFKPDFTFLVFFMAIYFCFGARSSITAVAAAATAVRMAVTVLIFMIFLL